jgi:predicted Kef-type K+ transport protein
MDPLWILAAFVLGFGAMRLGLPPLVGYLVAGIGLNALGIEGGRGIDEIADLGVLLLLFSIGLKLKLRSLGRPEIWAGATIHMLITVVLLGLCIFGIGRLEFLYFSGFDLKLSLLLGFALSFSSTVFAVKVLEARGEMASLHGRIAVGILIMQDILAVLFLTASSGKMPSPWALGLPLFLWLLRPILMAVLDRSGHRELLLLFAVFLALGFGAGGFELLGLKPDLGALVMGVLVAAHPKADELSNVLLSFKDLFLVGFFLNIGLSGSPTPDILLVSVLLVAAVPFKTALFFILLTRFRLRSRTALFASFSLANYSEFGLVVGAVCVKNGWLGGEWLVIIAIALSISFILASPLNAAAHAIYVRHCSRLRRYETEARRPDDQPIETGDAEILVFGMGRVGAAAYDALRGRYGRVVLGLDYDGDVVKRHFNAGRNVIRDDATDLDFWEKIRPGKIRMVLLALSSQRANLLVVQRLKDIRFQGRVVATARFEDDIVALKEAGANAVYNLFVEAGAGFAEHACEQIDACRPPS